MLQRFIDYTASIAGGAVIGLVIGVLAHAPWDGGLVGAVAGVFLGASVRAWRTRDIRESYEDRGLTD